MVDITVLGEITLDTLHTTRSYSRPGGAMYSALAASSSGVSCALAGYIGEQGENWVRSILDASGVDHSQVRPKNRATNRFHIWNADEVEPSGVERNDSGLPLELDSFEPQETKALLIYAYPSQIIHQMIDRCAGAMVCYDLQYDMGSPSELAEILRRCDVVFASRSQALEFFKENSVASLAKTLQAFGPRMVVIKAGLFGSTVYVDGSSFEIPCYESDWEQSVGAGDVYNAVFLSTLVQGGDVGTAGRRAASSVARYVESDGCAILRGLVDDRNLKRCTTYVHPDTVVRHRVYLAAPFFDTPQESHVNRVRDMLASHGIAVYSPKDVDGRVDLADPVCCQRTFSSDIEALESSSLVVALLDGLDPGTIFEAGFAVKKGIPVISLWTSYSSELNLMLSYGTRVVSNFRQLLLAVVEEVQQLS